LPITTRRRRQLANGLPALCVFVAIGSYGAVLSEGRTAWHSAARLYSTSQAAGANAVNLRGALLEPETRSVALGTETDSAASWRLAQPQTAGEGGHAVIAFAADDIEFLKPGGGMRISLDGSDIGDIDVGKDARLSTFPVAVESEPVSLVPATTQGYRFSLPRIPHCAHDRCRLTVTLHRAAWRVYRVAIEIEERVDETGAYR